MAFACNTFYTYGRAVPWFLTVLAPLKVNSSRFFADFAEWQRCNNCGMASSFDASAVPQTEIERMQLLFLELKYEEKNKSSLFPVVNDIVRLNGAISRLAGEGTESVVETMYNPDDLLGPGSRNLASFSDTVCMEKCRVQIFVGEDGPDYRVL